MNETVVGEAGMVVAPHKSAAETGADILRMGGNAIEAMIAAAATVAVAYPHMNGIGGDAFFLIAEPGRRPRVIDACGRAGSAATIAAYAKKGYDAIPTRGADAALTVPGAISGWQTASELASVLGGRLPRRELLAAAVRHAKEGVAVSASQARLSAVYQEALSAVSGFSEHYLVDGRPPEAGAVLRYERLADTLDHLANAGFMDFYQGDIAAEIAADLEAAGAPVTRADLAAQRARVTDPLSLAGRGVTLFNTPPPTQGLASLIILGLFDRLGVTRGESFDHIHGLIEAAKRALLVRDREIADPDHIGDIARFLDAAWLDLQAAQIDRRRAMPWPVGEKQGGTVWLGAVDKDGLAVSFIQSIYHDFGSGLVLPRTGVLCQNRGVSFSLDPASHNRLAPGRKPFHTLNPALARFADGRVMVYGSMGGDAQPQFQSAVFTRYARFATDLGEAVDRPRWRLGRTWGSDTVAVVMEDRFDPDLVEALRRAGHVIDLSPLAYSDEMGHAGGIVRRADGRLFGASDPRADGAALGA